MQYPVEKGIYVYFRYNDKNSIMVIANSNANAVTMDLKRFYERLIGITSYSDILNKNTGFVSDPITVPAEQALILKLY
jgi:predicted double-glycine peptidase